MTHIYHSHRPGRLLLLYIYIYMVYTPQYRIFRLYSERQILARGLAHPIVFMGGSTPRALDGVVDGVSKQSEEQTGGKQSRGQTQEKGGGDGGDSNGDGKGANGMQTFFTKV